MIFETVRSKLSHFTRNYPARMWISLIILIQFDHQNDYDQSSSSVRVVISTIELPTCACNNKAPQSFVCICALPIYRFVGWVVMHFSNPAVCICRQVISTLPLEHHWISPKTIFVFSNSNHLHLQTGDIHICQSLLFSYCSSIGVHSSDPF